MFANIKVADCFAIIGLTLQLSALFTNSWLLVERVEPPHCIVNRTAVNSTQLVCVFVTPYNRSEIARAGLWSVCYLFPHVEPPGHTDPYCTDFVEDTFQVEGLSTIQMLCTLSTSLTFIGSFLLSFIRFLRCQDTTLSFVALSLLAISGLSGIVGCCCTHFYMTKEYIVHYDQNRMVLYKWWAFHAFLDGSLVSFTVWLINNWTNPRHIHTY